MHILSLVSRIKRSIVNRSLTIPFIFLIHKKYERRQRSNSFLKNPPYRLHLGCGNIYIKGYCNVDIYATEETDVVDDIGKLTRFPDNSATEIYACHVLEHFGNNDISGILKRWHSVLRPGGLLRISVPDMDRIVKIYVDNWEHFQTAGNSPWIGLMYGGQSSPYDFHKTGFNFSWMKYLLEGCGFINCQEYRHFPHFIDDLVDGSLAQEPFGVYLSLNIMAVKPLENA